MQLFQPLAIISNVNLFTVLLSYISEDRKRQKSLSSTTASLAILHSLSPSVRTDTQQITCNLNLFLYFALLMHAKSVNVNLMCTTDDRNLPRVITPSPLSLTLLLLDCRPVNYLKDNCGTQCSISTSIFTQVLTY